MTLISKLILIIIYLAGGLGFIGVLPEPWNARASNVALIIIVIHIIETAFVLKHLKHDPKGLTRSILLSLLFGLLHWRPLIKQLSQSR